MLIGSWTGELGMKIRWHVPQTYALGPGHIIEIEAGDEALYPLAAEWRIVPRVHDNARKVRPTRGGKPEKRFRPVPHVAQGITADVVICPRKRAYGSAKNWPHWSMLAELPGAFAAGAPDSSYDVDCPRAWDHARFLDASIEALRGARLCIATDAGLAHLAVLCGTPLLLITHRGLVAPGPQVDEHGRVTTAAYWPVRFEQYYRAANHCGSLIEMIDGWEHPERVAARALELTEQEEAA
jgi:hypothetical protein